jgi:hypothetical protein
MLKLINVYGTDFSIISMHLNKSRDQIKRKYNLLDKKYEKKLN